MSSIYKTINSKSGQIIFLAITDVKNHSRISCSILGFFTSGVELREILCDCDLQKYSRIQVRDVGSGTPRSNSRLSHLVGEGFGQFT